MDENILGKRLKLLRNESNITQEEFGKPYNLKKSTVSQYESGASKPDDELKKRIARDYNVSLDWLMGLSDIRNPYKETPEERNAKAKSLREDLIDLMIKQGLIKSIDDIDEHMLKIIEVSIKTYAEVTNNKRKDQE